MQRRILNYEPPRPRRGIAPLLSRLFYIALSFFIGLVGIALIIIAAAAIAYRYNQESANQPWDTLTGPAFLLVGGTFVLFSVKSIRDALTLPLDKEPEKNQSGKPLE